MKYLGYCSFLQKWLVGELRYINGKHYIVTEERDVDGTKCAFWWTKSKNTKKNKIFLEKVLYIKTKCVHLQRNVIEVALGLRMT